MFGGCLPCPLYPLLVFANFSANALVMITVVDCTYLLYFICKMRLVDFTSEMVLISGKYKQAAGIVSKEVVVEHCAFTESPTSNWLVDVKCRSGGSDWKSLSKADPKAEVQMKTNDISIALPPLQEDTEIAVFGKPGEHDLKRMQMYVFGAKPVQGRNWMIYVYICDDTDMAFEVISLC